MNDSSRSSLLTAAASTVVLATTLVVLSSWNAFTTERSWLVPVVAIGVLLTGLGVALRATRLPRVLVAAVQVVVAAAGATWAVAGTPWFLGSGLTVLLQQLDGAVAAAREFAAPVPAGDPGVTPILVVGGTALLLVSEVLATTARRVPLVGLPLLAAYAVPGGIIQGSVPWLVFVVGGAGFLLALALDEAASARRAMAGSGGREPGRDATRAGGWRRHSTGVAVGGAALLVGVVAPAVVPTFSLATVGSNLGLGPGRGDRITLDNPLVDLRRDLRRGDDIDLVRVRTDGPSPSYLRISTLTRFTSNTWSAGDRSLPRDQVAEGALPLPGVDPAVPREPQEMRISIDDAFASRWLPTPAPASAIEAGDGWKYDASTVDVLATEDDLDAAGQEYTVTAAGLDLSSDLLEDAPVAPPRLEESQTQLPDDVDPLIGRLARSVTSGAESAYAQAVALQQWFREDGGFTYSLEDGPATGGTDDLVAFLSTGDGGRVGYCEQFASAMAVMARELGIPARVAVGFLTASTGASPDEWVFSAHDLHAWPELYFSGAGWVRFEPTPQSRAIAVPGYSEPSEEAPTPSEEPSASASPAPSEAPSRGPDAVEPAPETEDAPEVAPESSAWAWWTGAGTAAVVLVLLAGVPAAVRRRRRAAHLADGSPEALWSELAHAVVDLGGRWPAGRSPATVVEQVTDQLADRGGARAALQRLAHDLERARYAPPGHRDPSASTAQAERALTDLAVVTEALEGAATPARRRAARWWPASVLRPRALEDQTPGAGGHGGGTAQDGVGRTLERL